MRHESDQQLRCISFEGKRLARLLRQAALCHLRGEFAEADVFLEDASSYLEWAEVADWEKGQSFVDHWRDAIAQEEAGLGGMVPGAAWMHLAQEVATKAEQGEDWGAYLRSRWSSHPGKWKMIWRVGYPSVLSALAFAASLLILFHLHHGASAGENHFLVTAARIASALLLFEYGREWAKRAMQPQESPTFLTP